MTFRRADVRPPLAPAPLAVIALALLLFAAPGAAQSSRSPDAPVAALRQRLVPLGDSTAAWENIAIATRGAKVIGLGEATHGQHEVFDFKRRLTMALVRTQGVRVVAYEASASLARQLDAYVRAEHDSDSLARAMRGFGMLIWSIEENAALLRDLRAWNRHARPSDRVRMIGIDAQDGEAVERRLEALLATRSPALMSRVRTLFRDAPEATQQLFRGQRAAFDSLALRATAIQRELEALAARDPADDELRVRALELHAAVTMWGSPGGRDRAMATLLLEQLAPGERAVVFAHNAHVQRGPLTYLGTPELAMGGHLASRLGLAYYAIGVTFGSGGFQANAQDSTGRWGFRRYQHGAPPAGFLEAVLLEATRHDAFLNMRDVPSNSTLGVWLNQSHAFRWWGGYQVPEQPDSAIQARGASRLSPANEFDGLAFIARTTPAIPFDRSRLFPAAPR